ncbi:MAG TPA: hypothetical protein VFX18_00460 [Candidatus Nitrosocosmicus sp.]|nr:hypothetical protein [Candidatus Nitrosocosmicus sp.]
MRHSRIGEETLSSLRPVIPQKTIIDGRPYISFRDVMYNLVLNNIKGLDYESVDKKVKVATTKPLSPKHRKRIMKQIKKLQPRQ